VLEGGAPPDKTVLYASFYHPASFLWDDPFVALGVRTDRWYYCRGRGKQWLSRWRDDAIDTDVSAEHPRVAESLRGLVADKAAELVGEP
jgi:hypothetical protein